MCCGWHGISWHLTDFYVDYMCWGHCCVHSSHIGHLWRQNFSCPMEVYHFLGKISKFFGIFNGEITLFSISVKKWSSLKKLLYIFTILGGGCVSDPKVENSTFLFIWTPPFDKKSYLEKYQYQVDLSAIYISEKI